MVTNSHRTPLYQIRQSDPIGDEDHNLILLKWTLVKFAVFGILPTGSDAILLPGTLQDSVGWSDLTRSYRIRCRICETGKQMMDELTQKIEQIKEYEQKKDYEANLLFIT